jgi:hypothetical protein
VIWVNGIFWVNDTISVGINIHDFFHRDLHDIVTSPETWAITTFFVLEVYVFGITVEHWITWTVFSSPFIFVHN